MKVLKWLDFIGTLLTLSGYLYSPSFIFFD
jgi:hypothetical protein